MKDQISRDEGLYSPSGSVPPCRYEDPEKLQKDRHFRCKYDRAINDLIYVGKLRSSLADSYIRNHRKNCSNTDLEYFKDALPGHVALMTSCSKICNDN